MRRSARPAWAAFGSKPVLICPFCRRVVDPKVESVVALSHEGTWRLAHERCSRLVA